MLDAALPGTLGAAPILAKKRSLELKITNKGTSMCRVRIKPLVSPNFRLNYTPTGNLAPGLDVTAEIEFQLPEGEPALEAAGDVEIGFKEVLHVITNGEVIDVPLRAIRPTADVRVADHLDFGLVVVNIEGGDDFAMPASAELSDKVHIPVVLVPAEMAAELRDVVYG